jgi:hypothetical protein
MERAVVVIDPYSETVRKQRTQHVPCSHRRKCSILQKKQKKKTKVISVTGREGL